MENNVIFFFSAKAVSEAILEGITFLKIEFCRCHIPPNYLPCFPALNETILHFPKAKQNFHISESAAIHAVPAADTIKEFLVLLQLKTKHISRYHLGTYLVPWSQALLQ